MNNIKEVHSHCVLRTQCCGKPNKINKVHSTQYLPPLWGEPLLCSLPRKRRNREVGMNVKIYLRIDDPDSPWRNFILVVINEIGRRRYHLGFNPIESRWAGTSDLKRLRDNLKNEREFGKLLEMMERAGQHDRD